MFRKMLLETGIRFPKTVMSVCAIITVAFLFAFPSIQTDTDPVHMLPQDHEVIKLYDHVKREFNINDMIVLGITSKDGSSLFNVDQLTRIHNLTTEALNIKDATPSDSLFWRVVNALRLYKDDKNQGENSEIFVKDDVYSPSSVDDIIVNEAGELLLTPLMEAPPKTEEEAQAVFEKINNNPLFKGKLTSTDGSIIGIYIPLHNGKKERSYYLSEEIRKIADKYLNGTEDYFIAGLPVAETTFGNEMFIQMGVYAPAAGVVIFLLLYFFFRNVKMIMAPMMLAMMTVIWSMGALILSGEKIHIMSSMIPIFLMPIAVLDSTHILSTLHDKMSQFTDKVDAIRHVMNELYRPMLFTSVTTFVGFISLSTTGIPPVVVFGVTIAFGVLLAWVLSMLFIPAYTMLLSEKSMRGFGGDNDDKKSIVMEMVQAFKGIANQAPHAVIAVALIAMGISAYGITKIIINDNPVRWFKKDHVLRQADTIMNHKLAGTYLANLYFSLPEPPKQIEEESTDEFADEDAFSDEDEFSGQEEAIPYPSLRDPKAIAYIDQVGTFLKTIQNEEKAKIVGGYTSIVDVLKKVGKVTFNDTRLPETREKVSQYIFLFESGDRKKGKDMWKFIPPQDSYAAQAWVQFKSGDNQNMILASERLAEFMKHNPPPTFTTPDGKTVTLKVQWSGLNQINRVWQDEMVNGMALSLAGSFGIVFLMMVGLFRSVKWGLIAMLPLSLTILMIYGAIGYLGKFYDMPIAVLSSLTLGLSVDFSIHFIQHARQVNQKLKSAEATFFEMFQDTAQAIWRNVLVISVGFSPLFFAPLVPYVTVGMFFFSIMLVSGVTTLILLPAILKLFHPALPDFQGKVEKW